jgi:quercetin dioxygenase-like cupin family protein
MGVKGMRKKIVLSLLGVVLLGAVVILAQAPASSGVKRTVLIKDDLAPMPGPMTGYLIEGELPPGAETGWHTHPGDDFTYVGSGEFTLDVEGKAPQTFKAGTRFPNGPGVKHNGRNLSKTEPVKWAAAFVVEQGKPATSPAAAPAQK